MLKGRKQMHYYTTEEVNCPDMSGMKKLVAVHSSPFQIEARPCRRWGCVGKKGYWVRLRTFSEQGSAFQWAGFVENLHTISQSFNIPEDRAVWRLCSSSKEGIPEARWSPFLFF